MIQVAKRSENGTIRGRSGRTNAARRAIVQMAAVAGVSCLAAVGCGPKLDDMRHFLRSHEQTVSAAEYRVAPPDTIMISCAQAPEIDGEVQRIRTDGKIGLRLLGEVKMAGLTTAEAADKLERMLSRYYTNPSVNVRVTDQRSKFFYVFGQVQAAGPQYYTGRDTLLHALAMAQPTFLGWMSQVKVVRPGVTEGERHEVIVDVEKLLREGDTSRNILLQEGDVIYVPPTPLAWVGLRLREVLYPVTPVAQTLVAPAAVKASTDVYDNWNNPNRTAAPVGLP